LNGGDRQGQSQVPKKAAKLFGLLMARSKFDELDPSWLHGLCQFRRLAEPLPRQIMEDL
jgi:hypothetical protein